ncbi:MAG: hypothetical protein ABEJ82_05840 [Haloplanus sp.]
MLVSVTSTAALDGVERCLELLAVVGVCLFVLVLLTELGRDVARTGVVLGVAGALGNLAVGFLRDVVRVRRG